MVSQTAKWPVNLVIVRHAESQRNIWKEIATAKGDLLYGGTIRDMDVRLTKVGEEQANALGRPLGKEFRFDRVFTSPFQRTIQTAQLISARFPYGIDITEDERLREIDFGVLDGLTKHGVAHRYPEEAERKKRVGKYYFRPLAGENYPDVALRVHSFLGTLTREAAGDNVLVVCHSVVVLIFRKLLERLTEEELLEIDGTHDVRNCSVTQYALDPKAGRNGKLVLKRFNWTTTATP
jgi:broad specificity phosphatase PhoE